MKLVNEATSIEVLILVLVEHTLGGVGPRHVEAQLES